MMKERPFTEIQKKDKSGHLYGVVSDMNCKQFCIVNMQKGTVLQDYKKTVNYIDAKSSSVLLWDSELDATDVARSILETNPESYLLIAGYELVKDGYFVNCLFK